MILANEIVNPVLPNHNLPDNLSAMPCQIMPILVTNKSQIKDVFIEFLMSFQRVTFQGQDFSQVQCKSDFWLVTFNISDARILIPAYRTVKYKRTLWNRILRIRARSCGKRLGVSLSLPFCKSKRPAGPVCVTIVKLTCALLKLIVDESPLARRYSKPLVFVIWLFYFVWLQSTRLSVLFRYIRGMEPQLAFLISCDEDYSKCTMYLSALFESLRWRNYEKSIFVLVVSDSLIFCLLSLNYAC